MAKRFRGKAIGAAIAALVCTAGCVGVVQADSLYRPQTFQSLTSDARPRHVGDLITVMVYENASAATSANTVAGREASAGLVIQGPARNFAGKLGTSNEMDGHGTTQRENRVLAQITVTIVGITERGDLQVAGTQVLEINNERQRISVQGRVRPQDVSDTNVVLSTRIADARISYAGQGDLSDRQRSAWWQHFLSLFGI